MSQKMKTKQMKNVCRQAELMRLPFRNSSWTSKVTETEKKPLLTKKVGDRFRSKVSKLSVAQSWPLIKQVGFIER